MKIAYVFVSERSSGLVVKKVVVYNFVKRKSSRWATRWILVRNVRLTNGLQEMVGWEYRNSKEVRSKLLDALDADDCVLMIEN